MAGHKRKQSGASIKLPMPAFDSDSEEDEFAQDRPPSSKSKGKGRPESRSRHAEESQDEESDEGSGPEFAEEELEEGEGPGVAAWEPDEMEGLEEEYTDEGSEVDSDEGESGEEDSRSRQGSKKTGDNGNLAKLQKDLEQVPLYLLRKAQNKLKEKDAAGSDYDSDASVETTTTISGLPEHERTKRLNDIKRRLAAMQRTKGKALNVRVSSDEESEEGQQDGRDNGWAIRRERREEREKEKDAETRREERREKLKRGDKNAPMAMSVKRAVTRKRTVIEPEKVERRDPRFSSMSASNTDTNLTASSYSFVPELIKEEYTNLRAALQLAQKRERTATRAEREDRTAERERLEREVDRARTRLDVAKRAEREREVMKQVKTEQKERAKEGKGTFHLKRGEKKDLLLKARFDALQAQGGKRAVKKAIEKKQKKVAGKEKKSRPFAKGAFGGGGVVGGEGDDRKRRKVG